MQIAPGIGMIQGLIKYIVKPKPPLIEKLEPHSSHTPLAA